MSAMSQLRVKGACKMLDIEYPVRATRWEVAKLYNAAAKKEQPDKAGAVSEKEKRAALNRMQDLVNARDLVFKLHDRDAWQGPNAPLMYDGIYLAWNCEVGDKILVSRHHCTTIA